MVERGRVPFCSRTPAVRDIIVVAISGVTDCADVTDTHLRAVTSLHLLRNSVVTSGLKTGDFDGLTGLDQLFLGDIGLTTLPSGVFDGLTSLTRLDLNENDLTTLPDGIFDKLTALTQLDLDHNDLTELPPGVFDKPRR